jgi:predicted ATPase
MLRDYKSPLGIFELVEQEFTKESHDSIFTIIVGKNGTGKSRLLRSIALDFVARKVPINNFTREEHSEIKVAGYISSGIDWYPRKLICVSTSPFDRFPLIKRDYSSDKYSYMGLRGLSSLNLGLGYLSRTVFTLISEAARSPRQAESIAGVLNYLGYSSQMSVIVQLPARNFLTQLIEADQPERAIEEYIRKPKIYPSEVGYQLRHLLDAPPGKLSGIIMSLRRLVKYHPRSSKITFHISEQGLSLDGSLLMDYDDAVIVASSGLLKLKEVILNKDKPIRLGEASSGEQSVVMSLLGIGSQICDNAMICIDEPEVCLHPEWQEKYIELLFHTFGHYHNCHFIIATHSPQIVAQIPKGNCFVMSMNDGKAKSASNFTHRSIDFQLAAVFQAPGYKNEYLCRIALNAFAQVAKNKYFDYESQKALSELQNIARTLQQDDPLKELIAALEEMSSEYGKN